MFHCWRGGAVTVTAGFIWSTMLLPTVLHLHFGLHSKPIRDGKTSAVHNVDTTTDKQFIWMQCVAPRCECVHRGAGKESDGSANSKEKKNPNLSLQMHKVNRSLHRIELKNNGVAASDFTAGQIAQTHTPTDTHTHSLTPCLPPSLLVV